MALINRTSIGVVGIVGAVTLPPISLAEYLAIPQDGETVPRLALTRGYDIILGPLHSRPWKL
jgi:hypothetical protein